MDLSLQLNNVINRRNILTKPTNAVSEYLKKHPNLFKVALLVNHIFRALAMMFFMVALPYSPLVNMAICFASSLFYRLTVETNCAYKFALPAFGGAMTFLIVDVSNAAFSTFGAFALAASSLLPISAYITYVILTVSHDVDKNCPPPHLKAKRSCCQRLS